MQAEEPLVRKPTDDDEDDLQEEPQSQRIHRRESNLKKALSIYAESQKKVNREYRYEELQKMVGTLERRQLNDSQYALFKPITPAAEFIPALNQYRLNAEHGICQLVTKCKVMFKILSSLIVSLESKADNQCSQVLEGLKKAKKEMDFKGESLQKVNESIDSIRFAKEKLMKEIKVIKGVLYGRVLDSLAGDKGKIDDNGYFAVVERGVKMLRVGLARTIRLLTKSTIPVAALADLDTDAFIIEYHIVATVEAFRLSMEDCVRKRVFEVHAEISNKLKDIEKLTKDLGLERYLKSKVTFRLSGLLDPCLKEYIKNKISLDQKMRLTDDDLSEFFTDCIPMKYFANTLLIRGFCKAVYTGKDQRRYPVLLIIEYVGNLASIMDNPAVSKCRQDELQINSWAKREVLFSYPCSLLSISITEDPATSLVQSLSVKRYSQDNPPELIDSFQFKFEGENDRREEFITLVKTANKNKLWEERK